MTSKNTAKNAVGEGAIAAHKKAKGKFAVKSKMPVKNFADLSLAYTPGVGAVASLAAKDKKAFRQMTMKNNSVLVVSDGSAVLGLGNIGPEGALPVMEGKAIIFKEFAGIDSVPLVLATQDTEEIIKTIINISPAFGGINLEDISAPRCFEIEARLKEALDIPVVHDDQHGTAVVVLAALINAAKVVGKSLPKLKVVVSGAGPAGVAVTKLLLAAGLSDVTVIDSKGIIHKDRAGLEDYKKDLAKITNPRNLTGDLASALAGLPAQAGADVFVGLSRAGALPAEMVKTMAAKPIIFALANPVPEIMPDVAKQAGAAVMATGRSDFPNQINNALIFPGLFRGALDKQITKITEDTLLKAAQALAKIVAKPTAAKIIPSIFDKQVVKTIATAVR